MVFRSFLVAMLKKVLPIKTTWQHWKKLKTVITTHEICWWIFHHKQTRRFGTYLIINCRQNIQSIRNFNNLILFSRFASWSVFLLFDKNCLSTNLHHSIINVYYQALLYLGWKSIPKIHRRKTREREFKFINWMCGAVVSSSSQIKKL